MIACLPPARNYRTALKEGMAGHEVYALQLLLNELFKKDRIELAPLVVDGDYGTRTLARVIAFQKSQNLTPDGVAGLKTQMALAEIAIARADAEAKLPKGFLKGLIENESGYAIGSVNWSVAGGVDAGLAQTRIYVNEYQTESRWRFAFGYSSILSAALGFRGTFQSFKGKPGARTEQRAWELAALSHNWPYGADQLAKGMPLSEKPAAWVVNIGVRGVDSPAEWAEFYISKSTAYIRSWSV